MITSAVNRFCRLPRPGLWFNVNETVATGQPITRIRVWAMSHFTEDGSPFCCGEPGCHIGLFAARIEEVSEEVRRLMRLRQPVTVVFENIGAQYHGDIRFRCVEEALSDPFSDEWGTLL